MTSVEEREERLTKWLGILPFTRAAAEVGDRLCIGMLAQANQNADMIIEHLPMPVRPEHVLNLLCGSMIHCNMEVEKAVGRVMDSKEFEILMNLTAAILVERIRS